VSKALGYEDMGFIADVIADLIGGLLIEKGMKRSRVFSVLIYASLLALLGLAIYVTFFMEPA
jgi:hypothetical protein